MPIDDTGDPTEVQAPDVAPEPETAPIGRRPASGDALVASGLSQVFQNLLNRIAWLLKPFAKALAWAGHIMAFSNSNQHKGAGFDHQGLPAGRFVQWQEDWIDIAAAQVTVDGSGVWFGKWNYKLDHDGSGSGIFANGPWLSDLSTHPWGSILGLAAGNSAPFPGALHAAVAETVHPVIMAPDAASILEGSFSLNGGASVVAPFTAAWGFGDGGFVAGNTDGINSGAAVPNGAAYFCKEASGTFWRCTSRTPGGAALNTNTTVAIALDDPHRWRIEVIGGNAADDATAQVIFYIDGVKVATHAHSLVNAVMSPFARATNTNAAAHVLNLGPMRYTARLDLGDKPLT